MNPSGVWRNLDVAVKTVLFQDGANLGAPGHTTVPSPGASTCMQVGILEESQDGGARARAGNKTQIPAGWRSQLTRRTNQYDSVYDTREETS